MLEQNTIRGPAIDKNMKGNVQFRDTLVGKNMKTYTEIIIIEFKVLITSPKEGRERRM